nr:hypothetical protein [Tanacetum cinerariifolium]
MSSDSHATITYTLMSSYEVIVNGYFGMPMDPLDQYVQVVMEAPPSPDYIPPLPAAISPTAESPRYITESEPEMEPEEDDGDYENSEGDSIEYLTSRGDDDVDDDGDDLSKDDADDEDEEESSDSEEEEKEHLAPTVPTPTLHSSIPASEDSDETEPFEEGETTATPPPFGYRIAAKISVQPHILMPFHSESEVERLLAIPTPPLSLVLPTSYPLPLFLMPLTIFTPLPTSSFPLPLSLLSTSGSESIPEADIPLRKRARFTTPTGGYEIGESSVAAAAKHIRPALTIADSRRAKDRLIGRLRRERQYFRTLSTTYAKEVAHSHDYCTQIMDYFQSREKMAPKRARTTRANPDPTRTTTATEPMTQEAINNLIAQRVAEALAKYETQRNSVVNEDTSNTTGTGPQTVRPTQACTYKDYLNCGPLNFNGTEGVIGLTQWFKRTESVSSISNCTAENQMMTAKYCPRGEIKKLEVKLWNLKESSEIERYVGGLPEMIRGNVMSYEPKSMQKAIEFANDQMDQNLLGIADPRDCKSQAANTNNNNNNNNNRRATAAYQGVPTSFEYGAQGHFKNNCPRLGNKNQGNQNQAGNGNAVARAYGLGTAGGNPDANVVTECELLNGAWFLESKGSGGGRGVKEKNKYVTAKDGVSPSVTVRTMVTKKQSCLVDTSVPTVENTNCVLIHPYLRRDLFWSDVLVPEESIGAISKSHSLILKKWNSYENLTKKDIRNVPVWVKLHGVPITTFSEDGLSAIATKIGKIPKNLLDKVSQLCCSHSRYRSVLKQTTRISIVTVNTKEYHSDVLESSQG